MAKTDKARQLRQADAADYLTVEEAATRLGIRSTSVRNLLASRQLASYKFKTLTLLSAREVGAWKSRKRKRRA